MKKGCSAGFTLPEVLIMAAVLGSTLVLITESISSLSQARSTLRMQAEVARVGNEIARAVETDIEMASRVFTNTTTDTGYLRATAIGPTLLAGGARLPTMTSTGLFDADPVGTPQTGNVVFVAARQTDVGVTVDEPSGPVTFRCPCYRLSIFAPVPAGADLEMLHWVSEPLLPYWDLQGITDPNLRDDVITEFYDKGFRCAWDALAPRETGLFHLQQAGTLTAMGSDDSIAGAEHEVDSRPLARHGMRIAANGTLARVRIPEFAIANGRFPGGFEVKIDGASSGRLVLLRLVVESNLALRRRVFNELRRMISTNG